MLLPLYIVYKAEHLYNTWTSNGPPGARYNRSKSGWFTEAIFEDWYFTVAVRYFEKYPKESPKALIGDNLASHLSVRVIESCVENNIKFILLPPNSTHICQPLDVAFFKPLKVAWRKTLMDWKLKNRGTIPKDIFPRLLRRALEHLDENGKTAPNLKSGFKGSGLYPIDRNQVLKRLPDDIPEIEAEDPGVIDNAFKIFLRNLLLKETQPKVQRKKNSVL